MEKLKLKGVLELRFFLNGILQSIKKENNLIVDSGFYNLFLSLSGTTGYSIDRIQCGDNGATPVPGNTVITHPVDLTILTSTSTINSLTLTFQLGSGDANGLTISEFGIICADDSLFSRKSWTPFLKSSALTVEGTWVISRI